MTVYVFFPSSNSPIALDSSYGGGGAHGYVKKYLYKMKYVQFYLKYCVVAAYI